MEKYLRIAQVLVMQNLIAYDDYCFDDWDYDSWYSLNGEEIEDAELLAEVREADNERVLEWRIEKGDRSEHRELIGFKEL